LDFDFDICPHCGKKILKGAMRCAMCGSIQKSSEEQIASIKKIREAKKKFNVGRLIKFIVFIIAAGVIYYLYSDRIFEFITDLLGK